VLAGISLGAITWLQGIYTTNELVDSEQFGTLLSALQGVIGAGGPALGGLILILGYSRRFLIVPMMVGLLLAVAVLTRGGPRHQVNSAHELCEL